MAKSKRRREAKKHAERTVWSSEEEAILKKNRDEWLKLDNRDERDEFCTRVGEEIRELCPERYGVIVVSRNRERKEEWDRHFRAIKTWFRNHRGLAKQKRVFKFERKVQLRNVIAHYKHDEIEEEVMKLCPGEKPGSKIYFKNYQKALGIVRDSLSADNLSFLEEERKNWQAKEPPPSVQQKTAKKYGKRIILNMHEVAYKQMGMTAITIEAHRNENGDLGLTFHDYNKDLAGPGITFQSFLEFDRKACADFSKAFGRWVMAVLDAKEGRSSTPADKDKDVIVFSKGDGGIPIIPPPKLAGGKVEYLFTQREIIREFFRLHYRLATNNSRVHPPWEAMGIYPHEFFHPGDIPEGFIFRDPTRMKGHQITDLLNHLRTRQNNDTTPSFSFKKVLSDDKFISAMYHKDANATERTVNVDFGSDSDSDQDSETSDNGLEQLNTENPTVNLQSDFPNTSSMSSPEEQLFSNTAQPSNTQYRQSQMTPISQPVSESAAPSSSATPGTATNPPSSSCNSMQVPSRPTTQPLTTVDGYHFPPNSSSSQGDISLSNTSQTVFDINQSYSGGAHIGYNPVPMGYHYGANYGYPNMGQYGYRYDVHPFYAGQGHASYWPYHGGGTQSATNPTQLAAVDKPFSGESSNNLNVTNGSEMVNNGSPAETNPVPDGQDRQVDPQEKPQAKTVRKRKTTSAQPTDIEPRRLRSHGTK